MCCTGPKRLERDGWAECCQPVLRGIPMEILPLGIWCSTRVIDKPSSKRMGPCGKSMFGAIQASSSLLVKWPFDDLLSAETAFAMLFLRERSGSKVHSILFICISFWCNVLMSRIAQNKCPQLDTVSLQKTTSKKVVRKFYHEVKRNDKLCLSCIEA